MLALSVCVAMVFLSGQAAQGHPLLGSQLSLDDPVVGTWTWSFASPGEKLAAHGSVTFSSDGTMSWSGGNSGTWRHSRTAVTLTWTKGTKTVDTLTLSADGRTMSGSNNSGSSVHGVKKGGGEAPAKGTTTPTCRKLSAVTSPRDQVSPECVYTISYSFRFEAVGANRYHEFLAGAGTLTGTSVKGLRPAEKSEDEDSNSLFVRHGPTILQLDVQSARYVADASQPDVKQEVWLETKVHRSNQPEKCPKGASISILIIEYADGTKGFTGGPCEFAFPREPFKTTDLTLGATFKTLK